MVSDRGQLDALHSSIDAPSWQAVCSNGIPHLASTFAVQGASLYALGQCSLETRALDLVLWNLDIKCHMLDIQHDIATAYLELVQKALLDLRQVSTCSTVRSGICPAGRLTFDSTAYFVGQRKWLQALTPAWEILDLTLSSRTRAESLPILSAKLAHPEKNE